MRVFGVILEWQFLIRPVAIQGKKSHETQVQQAFQEILAIDGCNLY